MQKVPSQWDQLVICVTSSILDLKMGANWNVATRIIIIFLIRSKHQTPSSSSSSKHENQLLLQKVARRNCFSPYYLFCLVDWLTDWLIDRLTFYYDSYYSATIRSITNRRTTTRTDDPPSCSQPKTKDWRRSWMLRGMWFRIRLHLVVYLAVV